MLFRSRIKENQFPPAALFRLPAVHSHRGTRHVVWCQRNDRNRLYRFGQKCSPYQLVPISQPSRALSNSPEIPFKVCLIANFLDIFCYLGINKLHPRQRHPFLVKAYDKRHPYFKKLIKSPTSCPWFPSLSGPHHIFGDPIYCSPCPSPGLPFYPDPLPYSPQV